MPRPSRLPNYADPAVPLDAAALAEIDLIDPTLRDFGLHKRIANSQAATDDLTVSVAAIESGQEAVVGYSEISYTGRPGAAGQFMVDTTNWQADGFERVYEFVADAEDVADPENVPVINATTSDTDYAALTAKINSSSWQGATRQNVLAVHIAASDKVVIYPADAPGGNPVPGASGIEISEGAGLPNATLLRTVLDETPGAVATNSKVSAFQVTVIANHLTLAAAGVVKLPVNLDPKSWQVQVRDSAGRLKANADLKITVPTAEGTQHFLGLAINAAVAGEVGALAKDDDVDAVASASRNAYFSAGKRPVKVIQIETTVKVAFAGGAVTTDVVKTTAAGVETTLGSAIAITALVAHDPTDLTLDDVPLPCTLLAGEKLNYQVNGGGGLTTNVVTYTTHYVELIEVGDVLHFLVAGT